MKENENERGIKSSKILNFLVDLFTNKHVMIIRQGAEYLKQSPQQLKIDVDKHLLEYAIKTKAAVKNEKMEEYDIL